MYWMVNSYKKRMRLRDLNLMRKKQKLYVKGDFKELIINIGTK